MYVYLCVYYTVQQTHRLSGEIARALFGSILHIYKICHTPDTLNRENVTQSTTRRTFIAADFAGKAMSILFAGNRIAKQMLKGDLQ